MVAEARVDSIAKVKVKVGTGTIVQWCNNSTGLLLRSEVGRLARSSLPPPLLFARLERHQPRDIWTLLEKTCVKHHY